MTFVRIKNFSLDRKERFSSILQRFEKIFSLRTIAQNTFSESYYDTFDWSLTSQGKILRSSGGILYLDTPVGKTLQQTAWQSTDHFFFWDLEDGEMQKQLQPVAGVRAMSRICTAEIARDGFDVLNGDGKIVSRMIIDAIKPYSDDSENDPLQIIGLEEIKGYEKPFAKAVELLVDASLKEVALHHAHFHLCLESSARTAFDYSSKYHLVLAPEISLHLAVSSICNYLREIMATNYHGVMADIDTEFLHDFRIAVRRTRSLLTQLKEYLPQRERIFFQNEFKWLGSLTGPVRDLDVYLLMNNEFQEMLPFQLHAGLREFFSDLRKERIARLAEMQRGLRSERYERLMEKWQTFLDDQKHAAHWQMAENSCAPIARRAIRDRFQTILKKGEKITAASPDNDLHKLRIQGKKLRYLLEFFRSFYDEQEIEFFHKQLKKLQNTLGDFNDLSVQLGVLEKYRNNLPARSKRSLHIAAALGGLITHLTGEHQRNRRQFAKTFAAFADSKNRERFRAALV